ncbi:hypothetical protein NDU88_010356 [Pleurodeles waltl]|uniref:Uncharacterized protein n=1 Tax=Pleurodeles waltl TaxID=8319 RepID=A0AAV7S104_PLEWA|nr:hypothetical protein NDU88_010356 [Pleurodeles waltl]
MLHSPCSLAEGLPSEGGRLVTAVLLAAPHRQSRRSWYHLVGAVIELRSHGLMRLGALHAWVPACWSRPGPSHRTQGSLSQPGKGELHTVPQLVPPVGPQQHLLPRGYGPTGLSGRGPCPAPLTGAGLDPASAPGGHHHTSSLHSRAASGRCCTIRLRALAPLHSPGQAQASRGLYSPSCRAGTLCPACLWSHLVPASAPGGCHHDSSLHSEAAMPPRAGFHPGHGPMPRRRPQSPAAARARPSRPHCRLCLLAVLLPLLCSAHLAHAAPPDVLLVRRGHFGCRMAGAPTGR